MHLICKSENGFAKPSKPAQDMVLLMNPEAVQLFTLIAMYEITIKRYYASIL